MSTGHVGEVAAIAVLPYEDHSLELPRPRFRRRRTCPSERKPIAQTKCPPVLSMVVVVPTTPMG